MGRRDRTVPARPGLPGARLAAVGAALLATAPALARADNLSALIWVVVIWPVGVLLALVLLGLGLAALVVKRPAPRLGMVCLVTSALGAVAYGGFVELFADESGRSHRVDIVTIAALVVLAGACFLLGLRARRTPPPT
jgi:hypothetical protein